MSKNVALAVAAALCIVAAGVGGFLALQSPATSIPARDGAGSVAAESAAKQPGSVQGTEVLIPENDQTTSAPAVAASAPPEATRELPATRPAAEAPAVTAKREVPVESRPVPSAPPAAEQPEAGATPKVAEPPAAVPPAGEPPVTATTPPPVAEVTRPAEVLPPPVPPEPEFEELVVSSDSVLGLQLLTTVSTETAKLEDPVEARVTREVQVGNRVAIPVGTRMLGSVTLAERGGKMKEQAKLAVRFHTLVLADSTRLPVQTEAIHREGDSPGKESAAKVGAAAAGGAILGAILGGGKGAAIGGAVGAAGGTAAVMAGGRNPAVLTSGTAITVRLQQPLTVTVER